MTDLIYMNIPFVGRLYAQHDTLTMYRWETETLTSSCGREYLLCCGRLRIYWTPASTLRSEG
ncbi:hypothetical protein P775_15055 [Puniceibacterium antarcticum]|uniref:Uncharacterized protein n=1 Tax=Puniceibacterium antarcticum TaxID=1206336 RepID=A0A2G8RD02_9RHOB|nr:hypothetical protein [Puniceibacterium antarcticum]PIL19455.1 hypothetical protein P775_15055 [Puniceibacterium antarcticum]